MKKLIYIIPLVLLLALLAACGAPEETTATPAVTTTAPAVTTTIAENPASDFEYEIKSDNEIRIVKYVGDLSEVSIPRRIDDNYVTEVGESAFSGSTVVSVVIPDGVAKIGKNAFLSCSRLISVALPNGLKEIGVRAFGDCQSLSNITLPESLEIIGNYSFENCSALKKVTVGKNVKTIGEAAFYNSGLETVSLENCKAESIEIYTFAGTDIKEVVLPSGVKIIGWQAFSGCYELESVIFNEGLTKIDHLAFDNCKKLKEVIIPSTVKEINERSFDRCTSLEKIKFEVSRGLPCILFCHVPLTFNHMRHEPSHKDLGVTEEYKNFILSVNEYIINEPMIKAVFSGHSHITDVVDIGEKKDYTTGALFKGIVGEINIY